jgi:hypothetical protein
MAGVLALSGYHVPDSLEGDETNPRGFHEPQWVVEFHTALLGRTGVRTLDTDPSALALMDEVLHDVDVRQELSDWLAARLGEHPRLVIKDPRLVWFTELWRAVVESLGVESAFIVMLRHPSEVSSSRAEFYDTVEATGVAGWVNVALVTEQLTSGLPRAFVHYPRLTADWRSELLRVGEELGLELDPDPHDEPHPVDGFIDPALRRRGAGWEGLSVPVQLAELAERAHEALGSFATPGRGPDASAELASVRTSYAQLHDDSLAVVSSRLSREREARRKAIRRIRRMRKAERRLDTTTGDGS